MTNKEACKPCAKRKVRCDKQEPTCSNCRRRKQDQCIYPSLSPNEQIRKLEALVRKLGGDPRNGGTKPEKSDARLQANSSLLVAGRAQPERHVQQKPESVVIRSHDPVVLEEDGQSFYIESRAWSGVPDNSLSGNIPRAAGSEVPFLMRKRPHVFSSMLGVQNSGDTAGVHPSPEHAAQLWKVFNERVEPLVRITYRWVLEDLRARSIDLSSLQSLSSAENVLVLAIYLISINSMSEEECTNLLQESRISLLSRYQGICEVALLHTNLFCMTEINIIKALVFYMQASLHRVSTQSLWSLMGMTVRNAEKLGLHRDGTALGLSPLATEDRRRVWWQLQHIDLCLAIWSGLTPITLMAGWDAKIPSNLEDEDLRNCRTTGLPQERKGLTSMSYCRYTYWVLNEQKQILNAKGGEFALSWTYNTSLAAGFKESVVSQLEHGLNQKFLQYCDPLKTIDVFVQLAARYMIVGTRMRVLYASAFHSGSKQDMNPELRSELSDSSVQSLKYYIAIMSHHSLKKFYWYTKMLFSWHAFMFVLVEASRENDMTKAQEIWDLLADVYTTNDSLFELTDDRRRYHAAELVIAAWKNWQNKFGIDKQQSPPSFITRLEADLTAHRTTVSEASAQDPSQATVVPTAFEDGIDDRTTTDVEFDLDFSDIDWSFWSSME